MSLLHLSSITTIFLTGSVFANPIISLEDTRIKVTWDGDPNTLLQRTDSLEIPFSDLITTLGEDSYEEAADIPGTRYYRLVTLAGDDTTTEDIQLAAAAIRDVSAQIETATTPPSTASDASFTWVSQPGLIRTFTGDSAFSSAHKLYSSASPVANSPAELAAEIDALADWQSSPLQFVDINAPRTSDSVSFPILDPRAATSFAVEGFSFDTNSPAFAGETAGSTTLPMPVRWIYLLADGSQGTLDSDGNYTGQGTPSTENPITGRIAYWADDETSKVNVNTASEAVPWDVPRARTVEGRDYALFQPAQGEVQHYPGHPAMTSLSSILFADEETDLSPTDLEAIYAFTPKVTWGGTFGGTQEATEILRPDSAPLFPSVASALTDLQTEPNLLATAIGPEKAADAPQLAGFLTAHSSAPELTLHGTPRISVWPLGDTPEMRSPLDEAFAASTKTAAEFFSFQRHDSESKTFDFFQAGNGNNEHLHRYLLDQTYKPYPHGLSPLGDKYGTVGQKFDATAWEENGDAYKDPAQIATQIFDYIRSTNLIDLNAPVPFPASQITINSAPITPAYGQVTATSIIPPGTTLAWHEEINLPHGIGRTPTISEVCLVFFASAEGVLESAGRLGDGQDPYLPFFSMAP